MKRKPLTWIIMGKRFIAYTRGEARSLAKKEFGFKERLPVGTPITKELPKEVK